MKTIFTLTLFALLVSCTAPELEQPKYQDAPQCGTIVSMESSPKGEFIFVQMPYQNATQKDKYQIQGAISNYHLNQQICSFDGLTKVAQ